MYNYNLMMTKDLLLVFHLYGILLIFRLFFSSYLKQFENITQKLHNIIVNRCRVRYLRKPGSHALNLDFSKSHIFCSVVSVVRSNFR